MLPIYNIIPVLAKGKSGNMIFAEKKTACLES